jgi:hypothetical protein
MSDPPLGKQPKKSRLLRPLVGFKVNDSMSIQQVIQNPIQVKLLSAVKREKLNPW